jgi:hypothetical protein
MFQFPGGGSRSALQFLCEDSIQINFEDLQTTLQSTCLGVPCARPFGSLCGPEYTLHVRLWSDQSCSETPLSGSCRFVSYRLTDWLVLSAMLWTGLKNAGGGPLNDEYIDRLAASLVTVFSSFLSRLASSYDSTLHITLSLINNV